MIHIAPHLMPARAGVEVDCWSLGCIIHAMLVGHLPFEHPDRAAMEQRIIRGAVTLSSSNWRRVSEEAKDLVRGLLEVNPLRRYTIDHVLAHPWLQANVGELNHRTLPSAHGELREWQARKRFRKGINAVIAMGRLHKLGAKRTISDLQAASDDPSMDDGYTVDASATNVAAASEDSDSSAAHITALVGAAAAPPPPPPPPAETATAVENGRVGSGNGVECSDEDDGR